MTTENLLIILMQVENVFNEREIYLSNNKVIKPDKIIFHSKKEVSILDYKTGKPKKSDDTQVINYVSDLEKKLISCKRGKIGLYR